MYKSVTVQNLVDAGLNTRLGKDWPGKRCHAKTRKGTPCQNPAIKGKARCRMHGGKSTGPITMEGRARIAKANFKHGRRSKEFAETRKEIWSELRTIKESKKNI